MEAFGPVEKDVKDPTDDSAADHVESRRPLRIEDRRELDKLLFLDGAGVRFLLAAPV